MKKLTPAQAVKKHCHLFCMNDMYLVSKCDNEVCHLKSKMYVPKKIALFCQECVGDDTVKSCTGIVLNTEETRAYGKCPLHPFRYGKNPKKTVKTGITPEHLKKYKFEAKKGL